ncbi:carboxypeptidase-like regulatory domain-containing protein [Niabella defluvii]|nr:carboxypeptidase-like regulatory domain-containing protein [Niabella sp. I65]
MKYLVSLFLMLACAINVSAANEPLSVIKGTVRSSDNKPVANATVQIKIPTAPLLRIRTVYFIFEN